VSKWNNQRRFVFTTPFFLVCKKVLKKAHLQASEGSLKMIKRPVVEENEKSFLWLLAMILWP